MRPHFSNDAAMEIWLDRLKSKAREIAERAVGPHFYFDEDSWYSCGLAADTPDGEPGSGCANKKDRGRCTCDRDARVSDLANRIISLLEEAL